MRASLLPLLLSLAFLASCATGPAVNGYAPSDEDREALLALVDEAFDAIAAGSGADWQAILTDQGSFSWIAGAPGERSIGHLSYAEHLARQQEPEQEYLERIWDPVILVDGDLAMIWAPYDFHINGKFSHAGVDAMTFLRSDSGWQLAGIVWSVQPEQRVDAPVLEAASADATVEPGPTTEVFLVLARAGQPAELRLRELDAPRYPLSSREEVARTIAERGSTSVRVRHGESVPQEEINDLVSFLTSLGIESISFVLAPPPPSNPAARA